MCVFTFSIQAFIVWLYLFFPFIRLLFFTLSSRSKPTELITSDYMLQLCLILITYLSLCVYRENIYNIYVTVGSNDITSKVQERSIMRWGLHAGYDEDTMENDIAIIEVRMQYSSEVIAPE